MRIANHYVPRFTVYFLLAEVAFAILAVYLAAALRFSDSSFYYIQSHNNFFLTALTFAGGLIFCMSALGMYSLNFHKDLEGAVLRLMPALLLAFFLLILEFYLFPDLYMGRGMLLLVLLIAAVFVLGARFLAYKSSDVELIKSNIAFLGCGKLAEECYMLALNNASYNKYSVAGFIALEGEVCTVPEDKLLVREGCLSEFLLQNKVEEIIVAVSNRRGLHFPLQELLNCKLAGIHVIDSAKFFERETCQIRVDSMRPGWLIFGEGFDQSFFRTFVKRCFDLVASSIILILPLPIMALTAILIFLEDQGPVFYKQERVGLNGKLYTVLKFRSMRLDAEASGKPQWAATNDPRVTRVGRVIRLLRIDELPQIINVLKGEMSFVGPRPERPFFVDKLIEEIELVN